MSDHRRQAQEPRAAAIEVGVCRDPKCKAIHVSLLDHDDHCFAGLTIGIDKLDDHVASLHRAADLIRAKSAEPPERTP